MRIRSLRVQNFRGFRDEQVVDLAADVVILTGPNGTGKTSLLDAVQWLFIGDVERLRDQALKSSEDYLSNRYAEGPPFVSGEFLLPRGDVVTISRRGLGKDMTLQVTQGQSAPLAGEAAATFLRSVRTPSAQAAADDKDFLTRHLLQQDSIRDFLTSDAKERYEFIAELTGLDHLQRLDGQLKSELRTLREATKRRQDELDTVEQDVLARRESLTQSIQILESTEANTEQELQPAVSLATRLSDSEGDLLETPSDVIAALQASDKRLQAGIIALREAVRQIEVLQAQIAELPVDLASEVDRLEQVSLAAQKAEKQSQERLLVQEQRLLSLQETANKQEQLAAVAMDLLSDRCPVCNQSIDEEETRKHLRTHLTTSDELRLVQEQTEELRQKRLKAHSEWDAAQSQLQVARSNAERLTDLRDRLGSAEAARAESAEEVIGLLERVDDRPAPSEVLDRALVLREQLAEALIVSERVASNTSARERLKARTDSLRSSLAERETGLEEVRQSVQGLLDRRDKAESVCRRLGSEITEATGDAVNASTGLINQFYSRLDVHPTFRRFGFRTDRHYEAGHMRPWVYDTTRGRDGNAIQVLSSAQLNALAVSLFLALNLEQGSLDLAILDDPVQSMDDVNVLSLADIMRTLREHRQVLVTTHDRSLAELLWRKLRPLRPGERTHLVTLDRWGEAGPEVMLTERVFEANQPQFELVLA